jgi:hypothetical protein
VRLGTTYLDAGPAGERPGSVTGFDPPKFIAFHHTMLIRQGPLKADVDVNVRYSLQQVDGGAFVARELDLTIHIPGLMKLALPFVLYAFRKENVRIMAELKRYVETPRPTAPRPSSGTGLRRFP